MIVPGRPISSLAVWETAEEPIIGLWEDVATSTGPIINVILHIDQRCCLGTNLNVMAKHLIGSIKENVDYEL
ncbi:hypothetical protein FRB97_002910, partial [Tulasnella sp. 331]